MKIHWVIATGVSILGMNFDWSLAVRIGLLLSAALVIALEVLNTALEALVDLHSQDFSRAAKQVKDAAAGTVLVLSFGAVFLFADIVYANWSVLLSDLEGIRRTLWFGCPTLIGLALQLGWARSPFTLGVLFFGQLACLTPLIIDSHDPVFSACTCFLLVVAFVHQVQRCHGEIRSHS